MRKKFYYLLVICCLCVQFNLFGNYSAINSIEAYLCLYNKDASFPPNGIDLSEIVAFDCNDVTLTAIGSTITIDHLDGPIVEIQIFNTDTGWSTVFTCQNDCEVPTTTIDNLNPATYQVKVKFYDENWELLCEEDNNITVEMQNPSVDSLALIALYNATDGANWDNPWDLTEPIDTWDGIILDETRRVKFLALFNKSLAGSIPAELGTLDSLRVIDFGENQLTGTIPPALGNLTNLEILQMEENELTGNIPPQLGNLDNLVQLRLYQNQLTGAIPPDLGNLSSLDGLILHENNLTGSIPPELTNMPNLSALILYSNQLSGCYDSSFYDLCTAPINIDFSNNPDLPYGGDFDAFCATDGTNLCGEIDPCENNGGDADGDGICAATDCDDNDPNLPAVVGSACDDNDPGTTNDQIQADGCTCTGTSVPPANDCTNISITINNNSITVSGLTAAINQVQIFDTQNGWARILNCSGNCDETEIADGLAAGSYFIKVRFYTANWEPICALEGYYEVSEIVNPPCTNDSDGDGICADVDCDDDDPTVPTSVGTVCNDGDDETTNDMIQADGCTCAGSTPPTNDCSDIMISTDYNSITVAGLTATINQVQIFDIQNGWARILNCSGNCDEAEIADSLAQGSYFVKVNFYTANWESICGVENYYTVGSASATMRETTPDHLFFEATNEGRRIKLNWETNMSHKTSNFRIERSSNNVDFVDIGQQISQGEAVTDLYYEFTDENPQLGKNYYRIKQIFKYNGFKYTEVRKAVIDQNLRQVNLYPNPTEDELMIDLKVYRGQTAAFSIYNAFGQSIYTRSLKDIPNRAIVLNLSDYKSGVYYISIKVENRKIETHKFIIAKE